MKPIVEKVLKSGLVDKHTALVLERWGYLEEGASEKVNETALKDATQDQLMRLAEEIGDEVDKERTLRETMIDLDRLRWPTVVDVRAGARTINNLHAVIDRMGRFYFRIQDVNPEWFIPGEHLKRNDVAGAGWETIMEKTVLYIDQQPVCLQVSTLVR